MDSVGREVDAVGFDPMNVQQ
ncbi:hypothetical protein HALA3H3_370009 [Halomonas sp. A3H3]|nr:hypothetical protein HALA3H3_370009 [Halomonas sp. A3H3]